MESKELLQQVDYYSVPMLDRAASQFFAADLADNMGEVYLQLLNNSGEKFVKIMQIIANYLDDTVLFHCSAGKDRTGVTAMLLLLLAKVEKEYIVADYAVSEENMKEKFELHRKMLKEVHNVIVPEHVFSSKPQNIEMALDYIDNYYNGSVKEYLIYHGLSEEVLGVIEKKLV